MVNLDSKLAPVNQAEDWEWFDGEGLDAKLHQDVSTITGALRFYNNIDIHLKVVNIHSFTERFIKAAVSVVAHWDLSTWHLNLTSVLTQNP